MIRLATEQDLPLVGSIYEEILAEEEKRPASFTNWQRGKYPTVEHARAALEAGTLYVAEEDGEVYGCVNLNGEQLAEYAALNWSVPGGSGGCHGDPHPLHQPPVGWAREGTGVCGLLRGGGPQEGEKGDAPGHL